MLEAQTKKFGIARLLYISIIDRRTPLLAKLLPILVVIYFIVPFDIVPDFIPFAGYLDDIVVVPLGIWLALRMIPDEVVTEHGKEVVLAIKSIQRRFFWAGIILAVFTVLFLTVFIILVSRALS